LLGPSHSLAQPLVALSPDTTATLAGTTVADGEVASDDQAGTVTRLPLGTLPDASEVGAYHLLTRLARILPDRILDLLFAAALRPYFPKARIAASAHAAQSGLDDRARVEAWRRKRAERSNQDSR
jgi:hypothetical protein